MQLYCWDQRRQSANMNSLWLVLRCPVIFRWTTESYCHPADVPPYLQMSPIRLLSVTSSISCLQPFDHLPSPLGLSITTVWKLSNATDYNLPFPAYFKYTHTAYSNRYVRLEPSCKQLASAKEASRKLHQLQTLKVSTVLSCRHFRPLHMSMELVLQQQPKCQGQVLLPVKMTKEEGEKTQQLSLTCTSLPFPLCPSSRDWNCTAFLHITFQNQWCL